MRQAGLVEDETQSGNTKQKVRLKFRVSDAKWSEKWGVGLFDYEEFHVTDQLLKLPFRENPPKTVCIFSISADGLRFRMVDSDRRSEVNSVEKSEAIVWIGDKIRIGDALQIEVLQAPPLSSKLEPSLTPTLDRPSKSGSRETITQTAHATPIRDPILTESPTVRLEPTTETKKEDAEKIRSLKEDDGPTLTFIPVEATGSTEVDQGQGPIFKQVSKSVEIEEPTADRIHPDLRPKNTGGGLFSDAPVELMRPKYAEDDRDESAVKPVYPRSARLDASQMSIAERIFNAVARILRRDDIDPPENLPFDDFAMGASSRGSKSHSLRTPARNAGPWVPKEEKIELDLRSFQRATQTRTRTTNGRQSYPWIPPSESRAARMRGRAVVFMLSAFVTLAVATAVYRYFEEWSGRRQAEELEESIAEISQDSFSRGMPVEVIEEKVRRMKRQRRAPRDQRDRRW